MLAGIAIFSYSSAAVAFLLLSLLLLTSWRGRMHGMLLTSASFLTALWGLTVCYQITAESPIPFLSNILEILRNAGWTLFLLVLLGSFRQQKAFSLLGGRPFIAVIAAVYLATALAALALVWGQTDLFAKLGITSSLTGHLAMAVVGMILVEQLYRNTPAATRWGIKYLCLGIGGMFAYDFYLYSDAMLFNQVNPEVWAARGLVNAMVVPLIAVSAARNPQWSLEISVSRRLIFHSAALFGAAIYLLIMAATGYLLRFFGGSWGAVLQAAFLFGAGILLMGMLFSGSLRSQLKVFISKHFYSYNYDYREEWLRFTNTLSEEAHGLGERTVQALANLVESPGGGLWIRQESGDYEFAAQWNITLGREFEPSGSPFCVYLEHKQWVIDLPEYKQSPEKYGDLALPPWLLSVPRAWLVVPLILHRKLLGFVVLAQPRSKIKLNWEIIDLLKVAGNQAASYLAQQQAASALLIARQFESFNRMSTFVVHDLKNLVSQLSLMLSNAEKHKDNPEFQKDMMETVELSVQKMKRLLKKLSTSNFMENPAPFLLESLLRQAVETKSQGVPRPALEILDAGLQVMADKSSLDRVVGHLIQNAIEATPKAGQIWVRLRKGEGTAIVEVQDTGHGMSEKFMREQLFKPFVSTKPAGMGIGVFESREYILGLDGQLDVESSPSKGTTFRISLPLYVQDSSIEATA